MVSNTWKTLPLAVLLAATALTARGDEPGERHRYKIKDRVVIADGDVVVDGDDRVAVRVPRLGRRGYLGVRLLEMTPELRTHFGAPKDAGVMVAGVESGSPAQKAGVQVGDIITRADGETVESARDLSRATRGRRAGETLKIEVSRDKSTRQLSVTIEERQAREFDLGDLGDWGRDLGDLGRDIGRDVARDLRRELRPHAWAFRIPEENWDRMKERLEELEKRLKDLEKKVR